MERHRLLSPEQPLGGQHLPTEQKQEQNPGLEDGDRCPLKSVRVLRGWVLLTSLSSLSQKQAFHKKPPDKAAAGAARLGHLDGVERPLLATW